jgi:hypothetical protein
MVFGSWSRIYLQDEKDGGLQLRSFRTVLEAIMSHLPRRLQLQHPALPVTSTGQVTLHAVGSLQQ